MNEKRCTMVRRKKICVLELGGWSKDLVKAGQSGARAAARQRRRLAAWLSCGGWRTTQPTPWPNPIQSDSCYSVHSLNEIAQGKEGINIPLRQLILQHARCTLPPRCCGLISTRLDEQVPTKYGVLRSTPPVGSYE